MTVELWPILTREIATLRATVDQQQARITELEAALKEAHALNVNVFSDAEPEMLAYYSEHRRVIELARQALETP